MNVKNLWDLHSLMNKKAFKFFRLAKNAAKFSDFPKIKIGCVAIYKNKVISIGYNSIKTHPLQKKYNKYRKFSDGGNVINHTLHAEVHCLNQIMDSEINMGKVSLFIFRISSNICSVGMCRPCQACMRLIKNMGIKNIYYTTDSTYVHERII